MKGIASRVADIVEEMFNDKEYMQRLLKELETKRSQPKTDSKTQVSK